MKNRFGNPSLTVDTSPGGLFSEIIRTDKKQAAFSVFESGLCLCTASENQAKKREGRVLCRRRTRPLAKTAVITMVIPSPSFFFYTRIVTQNVKKVNSKFDRIRDFLTKITKICCEL